MKWYYYVMFFNQLTLGNVQKRNLIDIFQMFNYNIMLGDRQCNLMYCTQGGMREQVSFSTILI